MQDVVIKFMSDNTSACSLLWKVNMVFGRGNSEVISDLASGKARPRILVPVRSLMNYKNRDYHFTKNDTQSNLNLLTSSKYHSQLATNNGMACRKLFVIS